MKCPRLFVPLVGLALAGCHCGSDATSGAADAGADTRVVSDGAPTDAGAEEQPAWDPVWHLTKPRTWSEVASSGPLPDCGVACRIALNQPVDDAVEHGFSDRTIIDVSDRRMLLTDLPAGVTRQVEPPSEFDMGFAPYLHNRRVVYLGISSVSTPRDVLITDLDTGETKRVFRQYRDSTNGEPAYISQVALDDHYAYIIRMRVGIIRRDLLTGEIVTFPGSFPTCSSLCATAKGLVCADYWMGTVWLLDEAGNRQTIGGSSVLKQDGTCSTSGTQFAWVDFRDPPKISGDDRVGGEVYAHDFASGLTRRLTFDSPSAPRAKKGIGIDGDVVSWLEEGVPRADPVPDDQVGFRITARGKLDLRTGERCRSTKHVGIEYVASLHGQHQIGYWRDPVQKKVWLTDVDISDPALEWTCWKESAPSIVK